MTFEQKQRIIYEIFQQETKHLKPSASNPNLRKTLVKNQQIMDLFDKYDLEMIEELDVFQLRKYFKSEWNINLTEDIIRSHLSENLLEKPDRVSKNEFNAFHKYVTQNIEEIKKQETKNCFEIFHNQFDKERTNGVNEKHCQIQRKHFIIEQMEKPHFMKAPKQQITNDTDLLHKILYKQLFEQTNSVYVQPNEFKNVLSKNLSLKIEDTEKPELFSVDSMIQTEYLESCRRRKKDKYLLKHFNPKLASNDFLYSSSLYNCQSKPMEIKTKKSPPFLKIIKFETNIHDVSLYCKLNFYDEEYTKLTSDFYFTITPDMLKKGAQNSEMPMNFDIPLVSFQFNSVFKNGEGKNYAVLEVYKMMESDIVSSRDLYTNESKRESKALKKHEERNKEAMKMFQEKGHLQLLMFSAKFGTFKEIKENDIILTKPSSDCKDIISMIKEAEKSKPCGKWNFEIKGSKLSDIHHDGIMQVKNEMITDQAQAEVVMLTDFRSIEKEQINTDYMNLLFVYPTEISLGKEKKKSGTYLKVYLRDNDSKFDEKSEECLQCIYPMTNKPFKDFAKSYSTAVSTEKSIHFFDEVKIQLPFPLHDKHHLLFLIKDINVEDGSEGKTYYAKLPIYRTKYILERKTYTLDIMKEMKNGYLMSDDNFDNSKVYLNVDINILSNVYPRNKPVADFLVGTAPVTSIINSDYHIDLLHFLPSILDRCVEMFSERNKEIIFSIFELFQMIDSSKNSQSSDDFNIYSANKNPLIFNSIDHFCSTNVKGTFGCFFLPKIFSIIFDKSDTTLVKERLKFSWIIFSMTIKSFIEYYNSIKIFDSINFNEFCEGDDGKKVGKDLQKNIMMFSDFLVDSIEKKSASQLVCRDANIFFAEFIRDMSLLWKHDEIVAIIDYHLDNLTRLCKLREIPNIKLFSRFLRLEFVSVLGENKRLFELNGPQQLEIKEINKLNDQLQQNHAYMYLLMKQFYQLILSGDQLTSKIALQELLMIITKIDLDMESSPTAIRELYSNMLFPFVLFIMDDLDKIVDWKKDFKDDDIYDLKCLYIVFFYILKNMKEKVIRDWLVTDFLDTLLESLLRHMRIGLMIFSNFPTQSFYNPNILYAKKMEELLSSLKQNKNVDHRKSQPIPSMMTKSQSLKISRGSLLKMPNLKKSIDSSSTENVLGLSGANFAKGNKEELIESESGLTESVKFSIKEKKLTTTDGNPNDLVTELALIVMDFIEITLDVVLEAENSKALDRIEELISTILFKVSSDERYLGYLYDFTKSIIHKNKDFIFNKKNNLAFNLLKSLLSFANSKNEIERKFANNLIFIFCKTNFIVTGNTIATIVNVTSALSELQLGDVKNILDSIEHLDELSKQYNQHFDAKLENSIQLSLSEGLKRVKSLERVHNLYKAEDAGDLDVFLVFVREYNKTFESILDFILNAESTLINGYVDMKKELLVLLKNDTIFNMMENWLTFINNKIDNLNKTLKSFLIEKQQVIMQLYSSCKRKLEQLEQACKDKEIQMKHFEEQCKENKKLGEELIDWIKSSLNVDMRDLESLDDTQIVVMMEELEKLHFERTIKINGILRQYVQFDQVLNTFKLKANPLFPITSEVMTDGIRKVLSLHKSRIKQLNTVFETRNTFDTVSKEYTNKIKQYNDIIFNSYSAICSEIKNKPVDSNFLNEYIYKFKVTQNLYDQYLGKLFEKKKKLGVLNPTWDIDYYSLEENISIAIMVVEWLNETMTSIENNEQYIRDLTQWYENERQFIIYIVKLNSWSGLFNALKRIRMRESNDYLKILFTVSHYLVETVNETKEIYSKSIELKNMLIQNEEKREPLGIEGLKLINIEHFDQIDEINKSYEEKWTKEDQLENKRKEYTSLFEKFYELTSSYCEITNEKEGTIKHKQIPMNVKNECHEIIEKINALEMERINKLNRYCVFENKRYSIIQMALSMKIIDKDKRFEDQYTPRTPSTVALQRNSSSTTIVSTVQKKLHASQDTIMMFMDNEEEIKHDLFNDLSIGQRELFAIDLKIVQEEVIKILQKLNDLNELKNASSDPQFIIEKYYQFAMDYIAAPQLHMTWVKTLTQAHLKQNEQQQKQQQPTTPAKTITKKVLTKSTQKEKTTDNNQYMEAGMCEVYMICFIYGMMPKGSTTLKIDEMQKRFGEFVPRSQEPPNPLFASRVTEEMLLQHIDSACYFFEKAELPWYGIEIASIVVKYYEENNKFKELSEKHDYINRMYAMMLQDNGSKLINGFVDYKYIGLYGTIFGEQLNGKTFVYATNRINQPFLLREINALIPTSYKGEKHYVKKLTDINVDLINSQQDEAYIVYISMSPVLDDGDNIQYCNKFHCDEYFIGKKEDDTNTYSLNNAPLIMLNKYRQIITTEYVFPSLLKRQPIKNQQLITLTSIEIATEEAEKRRKTLEFHLIDARKYLNNFDDNYIDNLLNILKVSYNGVEAKPGVDRFMSLNLMDMIAIFFKDFHLFDTVFYERLFTILKEISNIIFELTTVTKDYLASNIKYISHIDWLKKGYLRLEKKLDEIEQRLNDLK